MRVRVQSFDTGSGSSALVRHDEYGDESISWTHRHTHRPAHVCGRGNGSNGAGMTLMQRGDKPASQNMTAKLSGAYATVFGTALLEHDRILRNRQNIDDDHDQSTPEYMAAAMSTGEICIFEVGTFLNEQGNGEVAAYPSIIRAHEGAVFDIKSMSFPGYKGSESSLTDYLCSSGEDGLVKLWRWDATFGASYKDEPYVYREYQIPSPSGRRGAYGQRSEANVTVPNDSKDHIYVGSGDSNCYTFDTETGQVVRTMRGHTDMIVDVNYCEGMNILCTASEDGTARIWDTRVESSTQVVKPTNAEYVSDSQKAGASSRLEETRGRSFCSCSCIDSHGQWLYIGTGNKEVCVWNIAAAVTTNKIPVNCVPHSMLQSDGDIIMVK